MLGIKMRVAEFLTKYWRIVVDIVGGKIGVYRVLASLVVLFTSNRYNNSISIITSCCNFISILCINICNIIELIF